MKITPEERIQAFWAGEKPDQIPYTVYWWDWREKVDDPAWQPLFEKGLRVTYQVCTVAEINNNLEYFEKDFVRDGRKYVRKTMQTPIGEISSVSEDGWTKEYWLKSSKDYEIMQYIVENKELNPDYDILEATQNHVMGHGIAHLVLNARSPMQTILVDMVGLENFAFHLIDYEEQLMGLYEALLNNLRKRTDIIAEGPGRYVGVLENFTAETMGPERFKKFHIPVYNELFPILQSSGKIVGTHYDGKLESCKELISTAPIDVIESLTPPPEGDMTLEQCRQEWPEKLFWSNINLETYQLDPKAIKDRIFGAIEKGSSDGRLLAFEISETIPENWKQSLPIVLDTLREAGTK